MKSQRVSAKKRRSKENQKFLLREAKYLMNECKVPLKLICNRLKLKYWRLSRIKRLNIVDPEEAFERKNTRPKYKKFHVRIRDRINEMLLTTKHPL